jgi:hypothetical protein
MSAAPDYYTDSEDKEKALGSVEDEVLYAEAAPDRVIANRFGILGPLLSRLFASGVEARGIERVPENQRESKNAWNKCVCRVVLVCLS